MSEIQTLRTPHGPHEYTPVQLYFGRKTLDAQIAGENLLLLKKVMDQAGIHFGLAFGTLLGAIRDGAFIPWDEDVDVFIVEEDLDDFLCLLPVLRDAGLPLVRHEKDLYSLMRGDDYIDVYIFRKFLGRRSCIAGSFDSSFVKFTETRQFLGVDFNVPPNPERFLETIYGNDWRIPRNRPPEPWSLYGKLKVQLRLHVPSAFAFASRVKRKLQGDDSRA
jgi:lipopolysaccharide cholinephosphotransferase